MDWPRKTIEIITLVYKSVDYANFITDQMLRFGKADGWDVSLAIIANDPVVPLDELFRAAHIHNAAAVTAQTGPLIRTIEYRDPIPDDYYLNRVYRAWNYGAVTSPADHICFVNSDMAFSPGWLDALLEHHDGKNIPCSRLVESGKMPSGLHGVSLDLGRDPATFDEKRWLLYANALRRSSVHNGGLFMPVVFETRKFLATRGYPEGNLYSNGQYGSLVGHVLDSGDSSYFKMLVAKHGMRHVTVFDSLVYHIQEGEKDA